MQERNYNSRILVSIAMALYLVLSARTALAHEITRFQVDADVDQGNKLSITETFTVAFSAKPTQPFERRFILNMGDAQIPEKFVLKKVTDEQGSTLDIETDRKPDEETQQDSLVVKIPSDNASAEVQTYVLEYELEPAIRLIDGQRQLHLEVIDRRWSLPVKNVICKIRFAESLQPIHATATIEPAVKKTLGKEEVPNTQAGSNGEAVENPSSSLPIENSGGSAVLFYQVKELQPRQGLVISVSFPAAVNSPWHRAKLALKKSVSTLPYALLALAVCPVFLMIWIWRTKFDAKVKTDVFKATPTQWAPPNTLSPAELGALLDTSCPNRSLFGTMLDLADRGHLLIIAIADSTGTQDYRLIKQNPIRKGDVVQSFEKEFLYAVFKTTDVERRCSELIGEFSKSTALIRNCIYETLVSKGYLRNIPEKARSAYLKTGNRLTAFGLLLLLFTLIVAALVLWYEDTAIVLYFVPLVAGVPLAGALLRLQAEQIPLLTASGANQLSQYLGMRNFLASQSKTAVAKLVKRQSNIFSNMFGHAFVFDETDAWATAFQGYVENLPSWFELQPKDPNLPLREWSRKVASHTAAIAQALSE